MSELLRRSVAKIWRILTRAGDCLFLVKAAVIERVVEYHDCPVEQ